MRQNRTPSLNQPAAPKKTAGRKVRVGEHQPVRLTFVALRAVRTCGGSSTGLTKTLLPVPEMGPALGQALPNSIVATSSKIVWAIREVAPQLTQTQIPSTLRRVVSCVRFRTTLFLSIGTRLTAARPSYPFKRFSRFTTDSMIAPNAGTSPNIIWDIAL